MRKSTRLLAWVGAVVPIGVLGYVAACNPMCGLAGGTLSGRVSADIVTIESACVEFAISNAGVFPDSLALLVAPDAAGERYLNVNDVPRDPWGRAYQYEAPACDGDLPRIWTRGRDGTLGGEGEDQDVGNWMLR